MYRIIILFLFLLSVSTAQENKTLSQDTIYILKPVIVEAMRSERQVLSVPYSVDIINMENIQQSASRRTLNEIVQGIPGLFIADRNNPSLGEKITIRGIGSRAAFGIRGIKILVDDIPLTMPDGQSQITNIDLNSAGRIDILRGPASSHYGNAAGGVINIHTEMPADGITVKPAFLSGSYGLQKYNLNLSGKNELLSYVLNLNKLNYKGYRKHSAMTSSQMNGMIVTNLSSSTEIKAVLNFFDTPYSLNPSSLAKNDAENTPSSTRSFIISQGAGEKTRQLQTGLTLNIKGKESDIKSTAYYISRNLYNPIPGRIIDLKRDAAGIRSLYTQKLEISDYNFLISIGADLELQFDERSEFINEGIPDDALINHPEDIISRVQKGLLLFSQDERVSGIGPFSSVEIQRGNFIFNTGLRYDRFVFSVKDRSDNNSNDKSGRRVMDQFSPMIGLVYRTGDFSKMFINYATSFQTPSANELGNRPDNEGGFNPALNPEKLSGFELGSMSFFPFYKIELSGAIFLIKFEDMLIPYQVAGAGDEVYYRNAGKAENIGAEIGLQFFPVDNLKIKSAYTIMNFIFKDYVTQADSVFYQLKGNEVPGIPGSQLSAVIHYKHNSGIFGEIKFNRTGAYFTNDFNGPINGTAPINHFINGSFIRTDIRTGFNMVFNYFSAGLFLGINNLFDKRYNGSIVPNAAAERFFEPAPGRHWYAGISTEF